jgi:hypothetical protein
MPTTRPRHQVTETDTVARALDLAARRWPGESRGRLLVRLIEGGAKVLEHDDATRRAERRRAIRAVSAGKFAGSYPPGYLDELRADWPE